VGGSNTIGRIDVRSDAAPNNEGISYFAVALTEDVKIAITVLQPVAGLSILASTVDDANAARHDAQVQVRLAELQAGLK
jgi:hypothetical protein